MMHATPKISIITASFNSGDNLLRCIESVDTQTHDDYEHIIVDAGSTDGTLDNLKNCKATNRAWISEQDDGIGDAMNKGIEMARGDWLIFLHTDDRLHTADALKNAAKQLDKSKKLTCFDVNVFGSHKPRSTWKTNYARTWRKMPGSHQGMFFHHELFESLGLYNTTYKVAMDYDFVYQIYQLKIPYRVVHQILAEVSEDGLSGQKDWASVHHRIMEERQVHTTHGTSLGMRLCYFIYWLLYPTYRKLLLSIKPE